MDGQSLRTPRKGKTRRPRNIIIKRTGPKRKVRQRKDGPDGQQVWDSFFCKDKGRQGPQKKKRSSSKAEIDAKTVRDTVIEELRKRNRPDIAASLEGGRPKSTRQERHELEDQNEPVLDNVAANKSRPRFDGITTFAKSTNQQG